MTDSDILANDGYDETGEFCPARLVDDATEDTALDVAGLLTEALADEDTPGPVARDIRARLTALQHRFPAAFA